MLMPVGKGERSVSLVFEQGDFALHTEGDLGAKPGTYRVIYRTELDADKLHPTLPKEKGLPQETIVIYHSPQTPPLTIPQNGTEELVVNIDKRTGWTRTLSD
ncbi:hypothetical protein HG15A2_01910 [Adhaeretor mobilis]|uniref:Uncharacterized protein n=2 Tax=Adhaeretor mobilis TaxID=1930276 RepID=A0A517MPY7_9BACT|nr:hypothetical protein HG15A2_01910 [Adhaeretor mobilis]